MFICEIILHSYLLFFMPRFSYIVHNILPISTSLPFSISLFLSLSVSGAFSFALYKFNYIRNVRATIENGFATLAMCSASFGQLLMVLSLPPSPPSACSISFSSHHLWEARALRTCCTHSNFSRIRTPLARFAVRVCVHGYCIWEIYFNANRTAISEAILTPWVATRSEETR